LLPPALERVLFDRLKDDIKNRNSDAVLVGIARDVVNEHNSQQVDEKESIDVDRLSGSWAKSFRARHKDKLVFGVQTRGESKEATPPDVDDCLAFIKSLEERDHDDDAALKAGLAVALDEWGVRLPWRDVSPPSYLIVDYV
jgi:hypothetical protein